MGSDALDELARLWEVQVAYEDSAGVDRRSSDEAVVAVLRALGAPIQTAADAPEAIRARNAEVWSRLLEPVTTVTAHSRLVVPLRVPAVDERVGTRIDLEEGGTLEWSGSAVTATVDDEIEIDGVRHVRSMVVLPHEVPFGYHRLTVTFRGEEHESLLVSAPHRMPSWEGERTWGVFSPLWMLRSQRSWGSGDLTDLRRALDWVGDLGGRVVATLPLLATFLDEPFEPSPYSPVSRLFWSEFHVDPEASPDLAASDEAGALLASADIASAVEALRASDEVDYAEGMRVKRRVLEALARTAWSTRPDEMLEHARAHPELDGYARLRAQTEAAGKPWPEWDGDPAPSEDAWRYHVYVQWLAEHQLRGLDGTDATLLFDLPLGVHPGGYDTWRFRDSFALDVDGGAPPDAFFSKGQNWGFSPLHPQRLRETRYEYPIACFRNLLRHAKVLRIDHVMGLHRLWWVPPGMDASNGAYVRYRAAEWYAILALEAHRAGALVVGEDLGTVPKEVRTSMQEHRVLRTYVVQEEVRPDDPAALVDIPVHALATINTHDMPPFAAWWAASDVAERIEMDLFDEEEGAAERERRIEARAKILLALDRKDDPAEAGDPVAIARAIFAALARSDAQLVVANLEDLWGETRRVNTPGTPAPLNWRRAGKYTLEEVVERTEVLDALRDLDAARRGAGAADGAR